MWKDRVWFFAAYDRVITDNAIQPTTATAPRQPGTDELFPATYTENKYSLKLTLNLAQSTTLQGVYFSDHQSQVGTISTNPAELQSVRYNGRIDVGGPDYGARLNQLFGANGILTLAYGQHSDRFQTKPDGQAFRSHRPHDGRHEPGASTTTGGYGNDLGLRQNNYSNRQAYAGNYTGYVGNHEFKAGGDYEKLGTTGSNYWTGGNRLEIFAVPAVRHANLRPESGSQLDEPARRTRTRSSTSIGYYSTYGDPTSYTPAPFFRRPNAGAASSRISGGSSPP